MRFRRCARLVVVAVLVGGVPNVLAAGAPPEPVSGAARQRLLDEMVDGKGLVHELRARFGSRLGPSYYDESPAGPVYVVGVIGRTDADVRAVQELAGVPGLVEVRPARFTPEQLVGFVRTVRGTLKDAGVASAAVMLEAPLLPERIVVAPRSPLPEQVLRSVRASVPVPIDTRSAPHVRLLHQTSRTEYPPYEAALNLVVWKLEFDFNLPGEDPDIDVTYNRCTSNFTGFSLASHKFYGTTAGHCGEVGSRVDNDVPEAFNWDNIGIIDKNGFFGNTTVWSDSARFEIEEDHATPLIARAANSHLNVVHRYNLFDLFTRLGTQMCWIGATTDARRCGELHSIGDIDFEYEEDFEEVRGELKDVVCMTQPVGQGPVEGDSGAPVYDHRADLGGVAAAGILLDKFEFQNAEGIVSDGACFQVASTMEEELGVEIMVDGFVHPSEDPDEGSLAPALSDDGKYAAFWSDATNMVNRDRNGVSDVFVRNTTTNVRRTERVSVSTAGLEGNNHSYAPAISRDGRYVVFRSLASNLVPGDTNDQEDLFRHDREQRTTARVSLGSSDQQLNTGSLFGDISATGRYVVFSSSPTNEPLGGSDGVQDVYLRDLVQGQTRLVTVGLNGQRPNGSSMGGVVSADGRYVTFASTASNLVEGDTNGALDIFRRDMYYGITHRVSVGAAAAQANGSSGNAFDMSEDGRYVVFPSAASNLVTGDTNGVPDIFVRDVEVGQTTRVSVGTGGAQANNWSSDEALSISAGGRYVAFVSRASNLVPGDTNGVVDAFVRDRVANTTTRVSLDVDDHQQTDPRDDPYNFRMFGVSISPEGDDVAFDTLSELWVLVDLNRVQDVYLRRRWQGADPVTLRVSRP